MMNKRTLGIMAAGVGLTALIGGFALQTAKAAGGKADPAPVGKITPWAAIKIATGKVPGRVLNANFELDEGKWVYGVMIVANGKIQEVEIDPMTGKIGDTEEITPEGEAKEVQAELTAALSGKPAAKESDEKGAKKP
jgi:hypothetical protein